MYEPAAWAAVVILVRFGELALKSRFVRRHLRDRLVANIQDMFAANGAECITEADEARIYVHTDDPQKALGILRRVFGIVSMSPASETRADLDSLRALAIAEASGALARGTSFALRVRRTGTHSFTSQDLAREIGAAVLAANPGTRVDLTRPDVEIHIEARQSRGFVFREIRRGPGGLPLGSQGRALAFVDGEPGLVAAWLGMKRGCRVIAAAPKGADPEPLRRWDPHLRILRVESVQDLPEFVSSTGAEAVFLGTRWGRFDPASRPGIEVPYFDAVIGLTDEEIAKLAANIRAA